jgi:hypothetical protein
MFRFLHCWMAQTTFKTLLTCTLLDTMCTNITDANTTLASKFQVEEFEESDE